ncbi:PF20097 family protein [bacterium]|nr:PF20097 family protein [bacterium]
MDAENEIITCPYCETQKEEGFIPDTINNMGMSARTAKWHPGKPDENWFTGLNTDFDQFRTIQAMRCPKCGHLDLFAV